MRTVVILALGALVALAVALLTGSTVPALAVIVLAAAGIVLLLRDWRSDRGAPDTPPLTGGTDAGTAMRADEFSPDISTDPGGPSSDARADQI